MGQDPQPHDLCPVQSDIISTYFFVKDGNHFTFIRQVAAGTKIYFFVELSANTRQSDVTRPFTFDL